MKAKRICIILTSILTFVMMSFIISLQFVDKVPDLRNLMEDGDYDQQNLQTPMREFRGKNIREKFQKINLKTLEQSQDCRFSCRPATSLHRQRHATQFENIEPKVKIMIIHCLRCLKKKGYMHHVVAQHRRKKRDLRTQEKEREAGENLDEDKPEKSTLSPSTAKEIKFHAMFGGWISSLIDGAEMYSKKKLLKQGEKPKQSVFIKRGLLQKKRKTKSSKQLVKLTKKPIIFSDHDEDEYMNNYGDETMKNSMVVDLENLDQKTQSTVSYGLLYALAGMGLFFMFIYPTFSFLYLMFNNLDACIDLCCCKDAGYKSVKKICEEKEVLIATYSQYKKLKKQYKRTLQVPKEKEEENLQNEEQDESIKEAEEKLRK